MRAPVAAQVRDCSLLLLKSISNVTATKKVQSLAFDKAVLPKRRKDLIDGGAGLTIYRCPAARAGNRRGPVSENLQSADHNAVTAENAKLPDAGAIVREHTARLNESRHAFNRSDKPPAAAGVAGDGLTLARPCARRRTTDEVTGAYGRARGRIVPRSFLHSCSHKQINDLQCFVMVDFLLSLAINSSLCLPCTETA